MELRSALGATFRSRRFWIWEAVGIIIYGIPVAIRFATHNIAIPILNFPGFWIGSIIPGNFLEKLLVNSFFPGGAGGVAGEVFFNNYRGMTASKRAKYTARLTGALIQTLAWSAFQFAGYYMFIMGPYGSNIFEHSIVFPINFVLAILSIFTPDILHFIKVRVSNAVNGLQITTSSL